MAFSKRSTEGYLLIDHTDSPGISAEQAASVRSEVVVPKGKKLETPTYNCSHCERLVIMRPDRSKIRGYCRKCDRYLCDDCTLVAKVTGECSSFKRFTDRYLDSAAKGANALAQLELQKTIEEAQRNQILRSKTHVT